MIEKSRTYLPNGEGWEITLEHMVDPEATRRSGAPLLLIPGYGMNDFVFGYHPSGTPMGHALAANGFDVWTVCLRSQGASRKTRRRAAPPSLEAYAAIDLPLAIEEVRKRTGAAEVVLVGCSLGGTVSYAYLALHPHAPVRGLITLGAPLKWGRVHPLIRLAFTSRRLVGRVPIRGTRRLARRALPLANLAPSLVSVYMNADHIDLARAKSVLEVVDDPHRRVNRDIAQWVRDGDLVLRGVNVTNALSRRDVPTLVILANRDGIVPRDAALSAADALGGAIDVLEVGSEADWYAHADLFIAPESEQRVFDPMAEWLCALYSSESTASARSG